LEENALRKEWTQAPLLLLGRSFRSRQRLSRRRWKPVIQRDLGIENHLQADVRVIQRGPGRRGWIGLRLHPHGRQENLAHPGAQGILSAPYLRSAGLAPLVHRLARHVTV